MARPAYVDPPVLVLMGVTGCGKSTVAAALAARLHWEVCEGDDLHPPANVAKMHAGHPLTDADRAPWLAEVRAWIDAQTAAGRPGIVTCSALHRRYRDVLRTPQVVFVHLAGSRELLLSRLAERHGHFMPAELLDSQLDALDPLEADEQGVTVDITPPATEQAQAIIEALALSGAG